MPVAHSLRSVPLFSDRHTHGVFDGVDPLLIPLVTFQPSLFQIILEGRDLAVEATRQLLTHVVLAFIAGLRKRLHVRGRVNNGIPRVIDAESSRFGIRHRYQPVDQTRYDTFAPDGHIEDTTHGHLHPV